MQYGSKNAKFDADFVSLLKAGKKWKSDTKIKILLFNYCVQIFLVYTFLGWTFCILFNGY